MRWVAIGLIPLALAGCGSQYKATGPVMSSYERAVKFPVHRPHDGLIYSGTKPASTAPIIPLMAFGAAFDLDVALMPKSDDFDMLEFARLNLPDRHLWLALETTTSGEQTVVANVDDIDSLMPEMPVRRISSADFTTTDLSTETQIDISLSYNNSNGSRVDAQLAGDPPTTVAKRRNGKVLNRSENTTLSVLDIEAQESLFKADVTVDGKGLSMRRINGIVPARFVQSQAQGGLAVGNFQVVPGASAAGGKSFGDIMVKVPGAGMAAEPVAMDGPTMVKMTVAQSFSAVKGCYLTRVEEEGADIAGDLNLDWTVSAGVVTEVALNSDDITDEALLGCINTAVEGWSFDPSVSGTVSWPVSFTGGDAPDATLGEATMELASDEAEEAGDDDLDTLDDLDAMDEEEGEEGEGDDGLATRSITRGPTAALGLSNFDTVHKLADGKEITLQWLVTQSGDRVQAVNSTALRTLTYDYRLVSDNYLELVSISVDQYGRATPVTAITFNPPLPDVRWPFNGRRTSDFVIDVNGQQNHGYGQVDVFWSESGPKLKVNPIAPKDIEDRVMQTSILYQADGAANVAIERIGE